MLNNPSKNPINPRIWLYAFIAIHIFAWTIVPYLVRYTLPMDAMEGTIWGQQFEWGYDKNPFLNGWLTAIAVKLGGESGLMVYLFSQLSVGLCFWAIWRLGKKILPPIYALLAVLLLEGIQYYNLHAIDFNDNTLELALWALTALFFYQALKTQSWRDWIFTGIFAGLGMMTKYYTVILLVPMLILLLQPMNRSAFRKTPLYASLFVFAIIITPHIIWLFFHDFVTVKYALARVTTRPTWFNHLRFSVLFAWQQFETFIPALLLTLALLIGKKPILASPRIAISYFDKQFLFYVGIGPFLLTILLSAIFGIKLRAGWGEPLLSLWGLIFLAWLQPNVTPAKFYRFVIILFTLLMITLISYATALIKAEEPSSANFPGKNIAIQLTHEWHAKYHTPLKYVAGSRWLAGNIAFYSPDHPRVYINWDSTISPWINEEKLKQEGGIFVWDLSEDKEKKPTEIFARYKNLEPLSARKYSWMRNPKMAPVKINVAFLAPQHLN